MTTFSNVGEFKSLFKMDDVSDKTKAHLTNVYGNLFACALTCALGGYLNASV